MSHDGERAQTPVVPVVPKYEGDLIDIELDGRLVRFAIRGLYLRTLGVDRFVTGRIEIKSVEAVPEA